MRAYAYVGMLVCGCVSYTYRSLVCAYEFVTDRWNRCAYRMRDSCVYHTHETVVALSCFVRVCCFVRVRCFVGVWECGCMGVWDDRSIQTPLLCQLLSSCLLRSSCVRMWAYGCVGVWVFESAYATSVRLALLCVLLCSCALPWLCEGMWVCGYMSVCVCVWEWICVYEIALRLPAVGVCAALLVCAYAAVCLSAYACVCGCTFVYVTALRPPLLCVEV